MDGTLLSFIVALLTIVVAITLFLVLRIAAIVTAQDYLRSPAALPAGSRLPEISGRRLRDGEPMSGEFLSGQAAVLVFLSPDCDDCSLRVSELTDLYDAINRSGVALWIISSRKKKVMALFLQNSPLLGHVLLVSASIRQALNPRNAAPFYVFVDHNQHVLASNFIGDENWQSFVAQIRESPSPAGSLG